MEAVAEHLKNFIDQVGYPGLFLLVLVESTVVPVPSEIILPFAGWLAYDDKMSLPVVLAINSAGAITGSGLSYWFGARGGKTLLLKYGKYIFVKPSDITKTEAFFARRGKATVLIARFVPVVRHIISIPAGVARMPLGAFLFQTFIGATIWGSFLIVLGYELGPRYAEYSAKLKQVDLVIGLVIVAALVALVVRFVVRRRRERASGENKAD
jgi:membrane protein DedA with SNARE-associated domain